VVVGFFLCQECAGASAVACGRTEELLHLSLTTLSMMISSLMPLFYDGDTDISSQNYEHRCNPTTTTTTTTTTTLILCIMYT